MTPLQAFGAYPHLWERLDYQILRHGPIALYFQSAKLIEDIAWFQKHNYRIYQFDCQSWKSEIAFYDDARHALNFPDYCRESLDSFNDCLSGLPVSEKGGAVLEFRNFEVFAQRLPDVSHSILDIIAVNSRGFLLTGRRFLALVHSNDLNLKIESFGCCGVVHR